MEGLFLLCSIITTSLISITLSLLLPLQYLSTKLSSSKLKEKEEDNNEPVIVLYEGDVWHERKRPVHNSFKYNSRYALLDLDRAPKSLPSSFFSNHFSAQEARNITSTTGPVFLLTIPPSVGYEQNPLSVYYCYELVDSVLSLRKCIAEVTNTPWGERVSFVFNPASDLIAKPLHVSPFMDMLGDWTIEATAPGNSLLISISVKHPTLGDYFIATLNAKRVSSGASDPASFFWLMPHKVALWIYWQALKLWWKNVQFVQHPRKMMPVTPILRLTIMTRNIGMYVGEKLSGPGLDYLHQYSFNERHLQVCVP
ncbi:hypothetical protein C5167_000506 [Papaver somniferum]|uniref:DUF1365 domain-containing protein n=1 Tax=Papaver somniferum TaxID=3469 RepID=A0A4Y7KVP8_PAPSO|nr:hypothetical protein C5167_000506 [Papaver somniferum]